jgi:hypothetical protein
MQRPNSGELLRGLRIALSEQVLSALPKGAPHQQLKAALHLIARLERSWDLAPGHLAQDNADIAAVLGAVLPTDGPGSLDQRLAAAADTPAPAGFNDPQLREEARRNLMLHALLLEVPYCAAIGALHIRMTERDAHYIGDHAAERAGAE